MIEALRLATAAAGAVALGFLVRRLRRLRARSRASEPGAPPPLPRTQYWQVYADVLRDLGGGGDGEASGDISVERQPRR